MTSLWCLTHNLRYHPQLVVPCRCSSTKTNWQPDWPPAWMTSTPSRTAASVWVREAPQLLLRIHCLPQSSSKHQSAGSCNCRRLCLPLAPPGSVEHALSQHPQQRGRLKQCTATSSATCSAVFFRDFVEHVSALCRVLRQPQGNALLVGVGGSGKQTLARFAAHLSDVHCFQIQPSRG